MLIERERGWLMHRWLGLEIVLPSVEHMGIVDRRLKGYHSLCPTEWLISKVRLENIGTGGTYGQQAWQEVPRLTASAVFQLELSSQERRRGL